MSICRGIPHILDNLQLVKPMLLYVVYDGVINKMQEASPIQRSLMQTALDWQRLTPPVRTWPKMGAEGRSHLLDVSTGISSRSSTTSSCQRYGINLGATLGPGLTETSPVIALSGLSRRKAGSVGWVIGGVNVWIVARRGRPWALARKVKPVAGCHNNPLATKEVTTLAPNAQGGVWAS
ncbi:hypothetical protein ACHAWF_010810 [Thalassiosira exigua]